MKITVRDREPLFDLLMRLLHPASRNTVRKLIQHGAVSVDGRPAARGDVPVLPGQTVTIRKSSGGAAGPSPFPILHEDRHVIIVEKPAGLLSIATEKERARTFYRIVNDHVQAASRGRERIFIVHRLDREVSGLMVFAKSLEAKERLQRGWESAEKLYCALVEGHPPEREGTIRSWLRESRAHKTHSCREGPGAKLAVTHYRLLKSLPEHSLLEIRLETGRKHQIRAHLAELGCPVAGDRRYGAGESPIRRLGLCAYSLAFDHPHTKQRIRTAIPIPRVMREFRRPQ